MWYILDENYKPIPASIAEYQTWTEEDPGNKIVKQENIKNVLISTVFLGLDHAYASKEPILWETMIFEGKYDQYQKRYKSYEDAVKGHAHALSLVENSTYNNFQRLIRKFLNLFKK